MTFPYFSDKWSSWQL